MMSSTPIEFWVIMQVAIDLCLIILLIIFMRQVKAVSSRSKSSGVEQVANTVEPVLREAQKVARQFEGQLKEKQHIVRGLNERLDSRIISLNLLMNRAEARLASSENVSGEKPTSHRDVYHLQQEIIALAENGFGPEQIADRLGISKGEVTLVLDLKKKFLEMEQA